MHRARTRAGRWRSAARRSRAAPGWYSRPETRSWTSASGPAT
jgi:hypothetical protein